MLSRGAFFRPTRTGGELTASCSLGCRNIKVNKDTPTDPALPHVYWYYREFVCATPGDLQLGLARARARAAFAVSAAIGACGGTTL